MPGFDVDGRLPGVQGCGTGLRVIGGASLPLSRGIVAIGDRVYPLVRVAERSFSVLLPKHVKFVPGAVVRWGLTLDSRLLGNGTATVHEECTGPDGKEAVLKVLSGEIDPAIVRARMVMSRIIEDRALSASVPAGYRELCADVVLVLRRFRELGAELDKVARRGEEFSAIYRQSRNGLLAELQARGLRAFRVIEPLLNDVGAVRALREYTAITVVSELLDAPLIRSIVHARDDFPGDRDVLNLAYRSDTVGETTYAGLLHDYGKHVLGGVVTRKDVVRDAICGLLCPKRRTRIAGVGCGTAQEIFDVVTQWGMEGAFDATLVDAHDDALEFAVARLHAYLEPGGASRSIVTRRVSRDCPVDEIASVTPDGLDLIYVLGLMDHRNDAYAGELIRSLWRKVRRGGRLIVGFLPPVPELAWALSIVLGFDLYFRDPREILRLGGICDDGMVTMGVDAASGDGTLVVHKC